MKSLFKKIKKLPLLLAVMLFVSIGFPAAVYAYTIYPTISYTPVATGGYTTISWSASGAANCTLGHPPGSSGTLPGEYCYYGGSTPSCYITIYASSGSTSAGPMNSAVRYDLYCHASSGPSSGTTNITVTPSSCTASSFSQPWNGNSYLIYSGGQGSISNWYGRYCLHNYSGSAIYIPMSTPTEWNDFAASASGLGVGITSY